MVVKLVLETLAMLDRY